MPPPLAFLILWEPPQAPCTCCVFCPVQSACHLWGYFPSSLHIFIKNDLVSEFSPQLSYTSLQLPSQCFISHFDLSIHCFLTHFLTILFGVWLPTAMYISQGQGFLHHFFLAMSAASWTVPATRTDSILTEWIHDFMLKSKETSQRRIAWTRDHVLRETDMQREEMLMIFCKLYRSHF